MKQFSKNLLSTVALIIYLLACAPLYSAENKKTLTLLDKDISPRVLLAPDATESEKYAARELTTYLGKMSGKTIETVVSAQSLEASAQAPVIVLGHHPQNLDLHPHTLGIEESVISVEANRVRIVGGKQPPITVKVKGKPTTYVRDRGTLYGVYNFLDDLGVRWYRPDPWGEHVPNRPQIVLEQSKTLDKPVYKYRMGAHLYRWWPDQTPEQREMIMRWQARNRINVGGSTGWDGGKYIVRLAHSHFSYLPPSKYFKTHPEYFALVNGKRINNGQLCLGNPEVEKIVGDAVIALAKQQPQVDYLALDPNDGMNWCECALCRAMDDPNLIARNGRDKRVGNASMANRVNIFNNKIARRLAQEVPGKGVAWLAYLAFSEVPTKITKFEPNTLVAPASIAAAYGDYSKLINDPNSAGNANLLELYQGYSKTGTTMGAHEYWLGGWWYGPMPLLTIMKDRLTTYRQYGVQLIYSETHTSWGPQGLPTYMYARWMWDPERDLDKELEEYCRNYYGPAAGPMLEYHRLLEKASLAGKPWFHLGVRLGNLYTDDRLIEQMTVLMNQATGAVKGLTPYERRVHGDWAGYEVARRFNLAMRYKNSNDPLKALATWDALGEFLQAGDAAEIWDSGPVFFRGSWKYQTNAYGMSALRSQVESLKKNPNAKILLNLNEEWKFSTDPAKQGLAKGVTGRDFRDDSWAAVNATSDWATQGYSYNGMAWYRKNFRLASKQDGKRYLLFFGAVDGDAVVYLNGQKTGEHLLAHDFSGYDKEFLIDVTELIATGDNQVTVQVTKDFALAGITKGVSLLQF